MKVTIWTRTDNSDYTDQGDDIPALSDFLVEMGVRVDQHRAEGTLTRREARPVHRAIRGDLARNQALPRPGPGAGEP